MKYLYDIMVYIFIIYSIYIGGILFSLKFFYSFKFIIEIVYMLYGEGEGVRIQILWFLVFVLIFLCLFKYIRQNMLQGEMVLFLKVMNNIYLEVLIIINEKYSLNNVSFIFGS